MEGGNQRRRAALARECRFYARLHLLSGLVGEGNREDLLGPDSRLFNQMNNSTGYDSGLAGARACEDQHGALDRLDGFSLLWIELI
jgi:hypothetical protein